MESAVPVLRSVSNESFSDTAYNASVRRAVAGPDTGTVVRCNDVIRFEHVETGKNLHGHDHNAPLTSKNAEVSSGYVQLSLFLRYQTKT